MADHQQPEQPRPRQPASLFVGIAVALFGAMITLTGFTVPSGHIRWWFWPGYAVAVAGLALVLWSMKHSPKERS